jgi:hypothetical protein
MNSIENNVKKFPVKIIPVVAQLRQRIKQKKGRKKKKSGYIRAKSAAQIQRQRQKHGHD